MKNYAIILAGGDGKRLGSKTPKCFIKLYGKELYKHSLETFLSISKFKKIVLVVPKGYVDKVDIQDNRLVVVEGGNDRNKSFEKGMIPILEKAKSLDKVLIHDAARPFVLREDILTLLKSNLDYGTLAYIGSKNDRDFHMNGFNIQTPQFTRIWLYVSLENKDPKGKDLISYFRLEPFKYNFFISSNKEENLKITFKSDLDKLKLIEKELKNLDSNGLKPNKETLKTMKECDNMEKHPSKYKTYKNVDELFKELDKK